MITTLPALAEDYLADLDRALAGADPRERAETLAAVRDHIAESLQISGEEPDAVVRVLDDLGPVDEIAASATSAVPPAQGAPGAVLPAERGDSGLLALAIVGLVLFLIPLVALAALIWAIVRLRSGAGDRGKQLAALWISVAALAMVVVGVAGSSTFLLQTSTPAESGPVTVVTAVPGE